MVQELYGERMRREYWRVRLFVVAAWLLYGLLLFGYKHLDHLARHVPCPAIVPFLEEMTGVLSALLLFPALVAFVRRFPFARATWWRTLWLYVAFTIPTSLAHTWLMARSRALMFPLLGLGPYDYGDMSVRYWMEMANDLAAYAILVMLIVGYDALRAARAREIAQAELRAALARAQVENLERRLHPHFLFNALNTISSIMYEDPAAADRMIAGLSDLLRRALRTGEAQEVPLVEELALLDGYLDIMRARFEERLHVTLEIDDDTKGAFVPPLLLQPLIENAIRHGADPSSHRVHAALRVRRDGVALRLEVRDHGRGLCGAKPAEGIGISTTARRLASLYGDDHRFAFEDADGGGLRVTIELPFRTTSEAA